MKMMVVLKVASVVKVTYNESRVTRSHATWPNFELSTVSLLCRNVFIVFNVTGQYDWFAGVQED